MTFDEWLDSEIEKAEVAKKDVWIYARLEKLQNVKRFDHGLKYNNMQFELQNFERQLSMERGRYFAGQGELNDLIKEYEEVAA